MNEVRTGYPYELGAEDPFRMPLPVLPPCPVCSGEVDRDDPAAQALDWGVRVAESQPGASDFWKMMTAAEVYRNADLGYAIEDAEARDVMDDFVARALDAAVGSGDLLFAADARVAADVMAGRDSLDEEWPPEEPDGEEEKERDEDRLKKCCYVQALGTKFSAQPGGDPTSQDIPLPSGQTIPAGTYVGRLAILPIYRWRRWREFAPCTLEWSESTTVGFPGVPADGKYHPMPKDADFAVHWREVMVGTAAGKPSKASIDRPGYKPSSEEPRRVLKGKLVIRSGCPGYPPWVKTFRHTVGPSGSGSSVQHGWVDGVQRY